MGKPVTGEVVVLPFPQTNLQSGKRRPALVVADLIGDDLVLCQITRNARSDGYSIPLQLADFERGRLAVDSFIRSNRLFTVEQSVILYAPGKIKREAARSESQDSPTVCVRWSVNFSPLQRAMDDDVPVSGDASDYVRGMSGVRLCRAASSLCEKTLTLSDEIYERKKQSKPQMDTDAHR